MKIDYDAIAATYDRRYREDEYAGVEEALAGFVGSGPSGRVLEVGCGTGHWLRFLNERNIHADGLDPSAHMLEFAHAQAPAARLVRACAEQLPWADRTFGRVFFINAFHHVEDKIAAIAETRRILAPGGRFMTVGLDPHSGSDRWWIYEYFEPVLELDQARYPATAAIRTWMTAAGFTDCSTHEVQHLPGRMDARAALADGRLDRDVTSQLGVLSDVQYQEGIARIREAIEAASARDEILYLSADLRLYATLGTVRS
jgi:SAM-dependent methyltransferase